MIRKIKNTKIINWNNIIENADVVFHDKEIIDIIPKNGTPKNIMIPGCIDIHIHYDLNNEYFSEKKFTDMYIKIMLQNLYKKGTTKILITSLSWKLSDIKKFVLRFLDYLENNDNNDNEAQILGINLEGPFISKEKSGMQYKNNILEINDKNLKELESIFKMSQGIIKIMTLAPELKNSKKLIELLLKYNIIPSLGHTNVSTQKANNSFKNNVTLINHLWNAMSGISHHEPGGGVLAALVNSNVNVEFIARAHSKEIRKLTYYSKGSDKIIFITDFSRDTHLGDGEYFISGKRLKIKNDEIVNLPKMMHLKNYFIEDFEKTISILENVKTMRHIVKNEKELISMSSKNGCKLLSLPIPEITQGYKSGIVLLDLNYNLKEVI